VKSRIWPEFFEKVRICFAARRVVQALFETRDALPNRRGLNAEDSRGVKDRPRSQLLLTVFGSRIATHPARAKLSLTERFVTGYFSSKDERRSGSLFSGG
jgi:hypothetical protein